MGNSFSDNIIETISVFVIIAGVIFGIQANYGYFALSFISLGFLIYWTIRKKRRLVEYFKSKLREDWAKEHKDKRDFLSIKEYYDFLTSQEEEGFIIDDITWRDLDMDSVFSKVDHTKSYPGMHRLYDFLRRPIFDQDSLEERADRINQLLDKRYIAQEIQYPLLIFGKKQSKGIFKYFTEGLDIKTNPLLWYRFLSYASYIAIGTLLVNRQLGFAALVGILSINAWIYQNNKYKIEAEIEIFKYTAALLKCATDIAKINTDGIDINQGRIKDLLKSTRQIYKNVSALNTNSAVQNELQIIIDYINMLTLREAIIFYKTINLINKYKDELFEIYSLVGEIDAYIAIASYKDSLDHYSQPEFIKKDKGFYLRARELYHPLVENPTSYSFEFDNKGALVTGSNASGKSTFLRTIGINTILSQSFYFVLSRDYKSNFFRLLTSIGTTDSIEEGDSYFMAEAKSLKRIIDFLDEEQSVLCILDEIFRGTNTLERISAASEVLEYMAKNNSCVVAATHDLELTTMISDSYENYHFKEQIKEHDIIFDYILRKGPTNSRNAIAILKYLGYPDEIYKNANEKVDKLQEDI